MNIELFRDSNQGNIMEISPRELVNEITRFNYPEIVSLDNLGENDIDIQRKLVRWSDGHYMYRDQIDDKGSFILIWSGPISRTSSDTAIWCIVVTELGKLFFVVPLVWPDDNGPILMPIQMIARVIFLANSLIPGGLRAFNFGDFPEVESEDEE